MIGVSHQQPSYLHQLVLDLDYIFGYKSQIALDRQFVMWSLTTYSIEVADRPGSAVCDEKRTSTNLKLLIILRSESSQQCQQSHSG